MPNLDTLHLQPADHNQLVGTTKMDRDFVTATRIDPDQNYIESLARLYRGTWEFLHIVMEERIIQTRQLTDAWATIIYASDVPTRPPVDVIHFGALRGQPFRDLTRVHLTVIGVSKAGVGRVSASLREAQQLKSLQLVYQPDTVVTNGETRTGEDLLKFILTRNARWLLLRRLSFERFSFMPKTLTAFLLLHSQSLQNLRFVNCDFSLSHIQSLCAIKGLRLDTIEASRRGPRLVVHHKAVMDSFARAEKQFSMRTLLEGSLHRESLPLDSQNPLISIAFMNDEVQPPDWAQAAWSSITILAYCRPFHFHRERHSHHWLWGMDDSGNIHFWQSGRIGWPTVTWRFIHGATGELRFGSNPLAFWDDWDEDNHGNEAAPTPYDRHFLDFIIYNRYDEQYAYRKVAVPSRRTTILTDEMEEELYTHGLLPPDSVSETSDSEDV